MPARPYVLVLLAAMILGCAAPRDASPASTTPSTDSHNQPRGRSVCPGSVPVALTNLEGPAADVLEHLQSTYEARPGFLAAVFDGTKAIVVVEAAHIVEWQAELAPNGVAVAPSCVDPPLLAAVRAVLPAVAPARGIMSAGYDALRDSISVIGVGEDALVAALDKQGAGMDERARAAINEGTLRINANPVSSTR